jgi:hypothetical protein
VARDALRFTGAAAAQHQYVRRTGVSAPELAHQLEEDWRNLPPTCWRTLGFRFIDRMLRERLARCFERAGHASAAERLASWPFVDDVDAWRQSLLVLRYFPEVTQNQDTELLAAFCCVMGNLPASILDEATDTFLQRASAIALILGNFSDGAFDAEAQAQREDICALTPR